jgi:carboxyl-terminal processing protease
MRRFITGKAGMLCLGILAVLLLAAASTDMQRMLRGQEIMVTIYRLILSNHVQDIPPDDLLEAAVKGMFSVLDPYAEFIEERGNTEMDILSRGSYSGLGIKVLTWENRHIVSFIYDDIRALTELNIGDVILQVDSIRFDDGSNRELRNYLRGEPGTSVHLRIYRPGSGDTLTLRPLRRKVDVSPLPYSTILDTDIAYIKLARFSRHAPDSLRAVLRRFADGNRLRGIILDVRDNPGGLLESAVSVVSQFVPPGSPVVSMRGRDSTRERSYVSSAAPLATDIPLVVLVNRRSASASEIVSGAIQDLDRGIVIGAQTFGKGLVQNILPMNYRTSLKLTTAKYYLPSGRCIQRLHYSGGKTKTSGGIDSVFQTLKLGRTVRESNGIIPDLVHKEDTLPPFPRCLRNSHAIFRFISQYRNTTSAQTLPLAGKTLQRDFARWLASSNTCIDTELREQYRALLRSAEAHDIDAHTLTSLRKLEARLGIDPLVAIRKHWTWISKELEKEFAMHHFGERDFIARSTQSDETIDVARKLLLDTEKYEAALSSGPHY